MNNRFIILLVLAFVKLQAQPAATPQPVMRIFGTTEELALAPRSYESVLLDIHFPELPEDVLENTNTYFWMSKEPCRYYDVWYSKTLKVAQQILQPIEPMIDTTAIAVRDALAPMPVSSLFLADATLQYDDSRNALYCKEPVALLCMQKEKFGRYMHTQILHEFTPVQPDGSKAMLPRTTICLSINTYNYIYFCFDGTTLRSYSYVDAFNYPLQAAIQKKKWAKSLALATEEEVNTFRKNFETVYGKPTQSHREVSK